MVSSRFGGIVAVAIVIGGLVAGLSSRASAQILIVGNDEKQGWDENGKPIFREPGKDTLTVIDISKPDTPRIASSIPLMNSVVGPPTNLAITPAGDVALVANSLEPLVQGWGHRLEPDDKVFLIDLKANPPAVIGTITVGKQPSGMAISAKGDLALVANRADGTISVLSIHGKDVLVLDTVPVGAAADQVSAVAITPDGKRALAVKAAANKVALLSIDGQKVTYDKRDLPPGIFPYNVAVTPDGKLALTADNGNSGSSDGNVDTVSVIDLEANPPRVIDHVTVRGFARGPGDQPEGRSRGLSRGARLEHAQDCLFSSFGRRGHRAQDRRQEGDQYRQHRCRRTARSRRVQPGWAVRLRRQLHRRGFVGIEGGGRQADRYLTAHQAAWPPGIDARRPAVGPGFPNRSRRAMTNTLLTLHDPALARRYYAEGLWRRDTLYNLLREHAGLRPDAFALRDGQRRLSWSELRGVVDAVAADLDQAGLKRGERVSVWLPNRVEAVAILLACSRRGYVCNPSLHQNYTVGEIVELLSRIHATALFAEPGHGADAQIADIFAQAAALPSMRRIYTLGDGPSAAAPFPAATSTRQLASADVDPDKIVYLAFTSGTTGTPKGVMHSDNTLLANGRAMVADWHHDERTVLLSLSPMSHHIGAVAVEQMLAAGLELVVNAPPSG